VSEVAAVVDDASAAVDVQLPAGELAED